MGLYIVKRKNLIVNNIFFLILYINLIHKIKNNKNLFNYFCLKRIKLLEKT